ncbi:helix-turn-helix domain-containing protein [Caballeronia zhejiangensis]|uniref:helix-turn-helix domain-containing protein n=1 Tax=Caballeronia zhejiangensis TaxID=871203 RepID=UPI001EF532EC|nr:helix-turn-helix transcriptional regulator [Caballeronia zhejiangensis]MCG7400388.1 helix-turn-helix domain-containing protein [Caballeronia zhejiangensis]
MRTEDIYPLVGETIRTRRKRLSLTQDQLATKMQMSRASLANIEAGRQKILLHHLYSFAEALELDVKDFLVELPTNSGERPQDIPLPSGLDERLRQQVLRVFSDPGGPAEDSSTTREQQ